MEGEEDRGARLQEADNYCFSNEVIPGYSGKTELVISLWHCCVALTDASFPCSMQDFLCT